MIAEYVGLVEDHVRGSAYPAELALSWVIVNPTLPVEAGNGTRDNPYILWPLDIWYLQPAEPGDLDRPITYITAGSGEMRPPGRSRVQ